MIFKLLTEHYLELLNLKAGCRGSSESTHVKMPHCLKSHALAHMIVDSYNVDNYAKPARWTTVFKGRRLPTSLRSQTKLAALRVGSLPSIVKLVP